MTQDRVADSLSNALANLQAERNRITAAIEQLEGFMRELSAVKRHATAIPAAPRTRRGPRWSPAARRAVAERMRKYWAKRRKAKAGKKAGAARKASKPAKAAPRSGKTAARKAKPARAVRKAKTPVRRAPRPVAAPVAEAPAPVEAAPAT